MASAPPPPGPPTPTNPADAPPWASGRFVLRVHGVGSNWRRDVEIRRPFALIGRIPGADVQIDDPDVNSRHAYLHLDRRGLFAVDLASRTGTHIGPQGRAAAGWLRPGEALEVAGRRIELRELFIEDAEPAGPGADDLLADCGGRSRVHVTLFPGGSPDAPLVLNSELVFLGRSAACGVHVDEPGAARIQCALVRGERAAYVVDLLGRTSWLNGRPLREVVELRDGDVLGVGSTRFECRLIPPQSAGLPARRAPATPVYVPTPTIPAQAAEILPQSAMPPLPLELANPEQQGQILAWMMGVLQATQGEMLRRQAEFQNDVVSVLRQIQSENNAALDKHLERVDALNRELSSLREEVRRRYGPSSAPNRPEPPKVAPLRITPTAPPETPEAAEAAASWLLDRVQQIDQESRTSWRELLGRLGRGPK